MARTQIVLRFFQLVLFFCGVCCPGGAAKAQVVAAQFKTAVHPRVFATGADRAALLKKVRDVPWARDLFTGLQTHIDQILTVSERDRGFLPSRLQMNWEAGKRY